MSSSRDEIQRAFTPEAQARLVRAGESLAARQASSGAGRGNVAPWAGSDEPDFHGTLSAIFVWSRAQDLAADDRFSLNVASAWSFIDEAWRRFIPDALGPEAGEEAAYDCAMVLAAALADSDGAGKEPRAERVAAAARLLAAYLSDLTDLTGREFRDPSFLAWTLAEYARARNDRGMLAGVRRFVDRAFGMKSPPQFAGEAVATDGLFDFSSTTAMRVLAVIAGEGPTPFVGAWLRERVVAAIPAAFVGRPLDENCWNACVAVACGRAFVISTDPAFFSAYRAIVTELARREQGGGIGRKPGFPAETAATFYYALALDALVRP